MSAAEPVHTTGPENSPATVYAFRRPRRHSRETRVPNQPPSDLTPGQKLAASLERAFADHGRSLTDPDTGQDFTITLAILRTLLQGALEQGRLGQEEFEMLDGMIDGMLEAPRLLA